MPAKEPFARTKLSSREPIVKTNQIPEFSALDFPDTSLTPEE